MTYLESYKNSLVNGDAASASKTIDDALASGLSPSKVYTSVLIPAQREMAKLVSDSKVGVCECHRASQITLSEMARLRFLIKPLTTLGKKAAFTSIDADEHYLGTRIVADFLLMDGWDVHFLGSKTPTKDLVSFIETNKFDIVGVGAASSASLEILKDTIEKIKHISPAPKVMIGGDGVYKNIEKAKSFLADSIAFNAEEAVIIARKLCGISSQDSCLSNYLKGLGDRIVESRKLRKLSQQKLAESSGLDRAYISSVENGKQNVTIGAIVKLATALDIPLDSLLVRK